jgi:SPP1 family predicted phage head-tail adaptor
MLAAGKLKTLISIQQRDLTQDSAGQPSDDWVEVAKPWAWIRVLNGREFATSGSDASQATSSIRIRYRSDITAAMRVVSPKGVIYDIVAVLPDEDCNEYVDLACTTGVNNG